MVYYSIVMKHLIQTFENIVYTYDPNEFMPIFYNGSLTNKSDFLLYKAKKASARLFSR